jgi:aromatic-L-amino-acid decarboxylase
LKLDDHLDPADWPTMIEYLSTFTAEEIRELADSIRGKVWQPVPDSQQQAWRDEPAPRGGMPLDEVVAQYREQIRPYRNGNTHPRFFGWVQGTGHVPALMADIAVSLMNPNCGGRDHGAIYIERMVIDWCKQIFCFPVESGGLMTSGTSASTQLALQVAMFRKLGLEHKNKGFFNVCKPLRCYTSVEGHSSIIKAIQTCGIGSDNLVVIDTDDNHTILLPELKARIEADIEQGYMPFMVIANAGTVNTGSFDDFNAIRELCDRYDCWMHIDGAFGAWMKIADESHAQLTSGLEKADSLAFDFHKLMYIQYDCGAVLMRDGAFQQQVFSIRPNYLSTHGQALAGGDPWFCDYGMELSRSFRALKVWFTLKTYGLDKLGQAVSENCRLAALLAQGIEESDCFQLAKQPVSNIVTFQMKSRIGDKSITGEENDQLCEQIVTRLQMDGDAVFSLTRQGQYRVIRASVTNHRTRNDDIDFVLQRLHALAREMTGCEEGKKA